MLDQMNVTVCRSQNHISEPNNAATDIIACQQEAAIQILTVFWKIPFIGLENWNFEEVFFAVNGDVLGSLKIFFKQKIEKIAWLKFKNE